MGLYSSELDHMLRTGRVTSDSYVGTFPCDFLRALTLSSTPAFYIVNVSPSTTKGTHWIGLYFNSDGSEADFFDTYGSALSRHKDIRDFVVNSVSGGIVNELRGPPLQGDSSNVCGHWCILFAEQRCKDVSMREFVSVFDDTRPGHFDADVKERVLSSYCLLNKCKRSKESCPIEQSCLCKYQVCCK